MLSLNCKSGPIRIGLIADEPIPLAGLASIFDQPALDSHAQLIPVIGGMLAASFIAIFMVPVLFYLVERFSAKKETPVTGELGAQEEVSKEAGASTK